MIRFSKILLLIIFISNISFGQNTQNPHAFTARGLFINYRDLNTSIIPQDAIITNGLELGYSRNLKTDFLNFSVPLKLGVARFIDAPENVQFLSIDGIIQAQYYKDDNPVVPYVFGGAGGVFDNFKNVNIQFPIGVGLNFRIKNGLYLSVQGEARLSTALQRNNMQLGLGFLYNMGKFKKSKFIDAENFNLDSDNDGVTDNLDKCPGIAGNIATFGCPDKDKDGVADVEDKCPDDAGTLAAKGCPDQDGDGIPDSEDKCKDKYGSVENMGCPFDNIDADEDGVIDKLDDCPTEAGTAAAKGCPDKDGDGVADKYDNCPDVKGTARTNGCPDADGDGVGDNIDKCPTQPGTAANNGCPNIEKEDQEVLDLAMHAVQFETGKSTLKMESFQMLDKISKILLKYRDYKLSVEGHTDNKGSDTDNMRLSSERAKACMDYILFKAIESNRLYSKGYGESKPISSNDTEDGRSNNRRVEFNLITN
jgi:OmpA-OmpF porin, OOP family